MLQVVILVECVVLGAVHAVLERSCCLHVMFMLSKMKCAVWRSCWACCPGAEGVAGYCPAAVVPCRCCQACCPSAEGVAGRGGCCPAAAIPCRCCRVLLLFRPWGELLSMLSGAAECCCCPSAVQQLHVLSMLSNKLGFGDRGVLLDVICCWRSVELLSMLSSRCCPSLGEVLPMLSSSLVLGVEKEGCCCQRA